MSLTPSHLHVHIKLNLLAVYWLSNCSDTESDVLPVNQPVVSKLWCKSKAQPRKVTHWRHCFFGHQPIPSLYVGPSVHKCNKSFLNVSCKSRTHTWNHWAEMRRRRNEEHWTANAFICCLLKFYSTCFNRRVLLTCFYSLVRPTC